MFIFFFSRKLQLYAEVDHIMKVGKNNFRPAPNVESSVVRVVPRDPPPPVKFEEFDGLTRIVFSRRNKTIHASFMAKGVIEMLEGNYKTWCAENNKVRFVSVLSCPIGNLDFRGTFRMFWVQSYSVRC